MKPKIILCLVAGVGIDTATAQDLKDWGARPSRSPWGASRAPLLRLVAPGIFFGWAAFKQKAVWTVFGGTPNTARETHALPEIAVARSDPLKTSKNEKV